MVSGVFGKGDVPVRNVYEKIETPRLVLIRCFCHEPSVVMLALPCIALGRTPALEEFFVLVRALLCGTQHQLPQHNITNHIVCIAHASLIYPFSFIPTMLLVAGHAKVTDAWSTLLPMDRSDV